MNSKELKAYARKILNDANCNIHAYAGEQAKYIMDDLKEAFPNGMKYPYINVANAILAMSRPEPIHRAPYHVVWNTDDCIDGYDADSFGSAKESALDTLLNWMYTESETWNFMQDDNGSIIPTPTEEQIESWDYMIFNCWVEVYKYNPDTDEYEEYWSPSYEDEKEIGWCAWEEKKTIDHAAPAVV